MSLLAHRFGLLLVAVLALPWLLRGTVPLVSLQFDGDRVLLSFTGALQHAPVVGGPFTNVAAAISPFRLEPLESSGFWRARIPNVIAIAAGSSHSLALRRDGSLWAWGENQSGQLGAQGISKTNRPIPVGTNTHWRQVAAGDGYSLALRNDHTLWAWGDNLRGQLGLGDLARATEPQQVGREADWDSIATAGEFSAAIKQDGTLWGWGFGQLREPTRLAPTTDWVSVRPGQNIAMIDGRGALWRIRASADGDATQEPGAPTSWLARVTESEGWSDARIGGSHFLALRKDGALWSWGSRRSAGLGDSGFEPVPVETVPGSRWRTIAAGDWYSLGIRDDGTLWSWGRNETGWIDSLAPGAFDEHPTNVTSGDNWIAVAAGGFHSLALRDDGELWTWGLGPGCATRPDWPALGGDCGDSGRLGNPWIRSHAIPLALTGTNQWDATAAGGRLAFALAADGTLYGWGYGFIGNGDYRPRNQPQLSNFTFPIKTIAAGNGHSLAIGADGTLWATGDNIWGQLGTNSPKEFLFYQPLPDWTRVDQNASWVQVACGYTHSVALQADGSLWTWGSNQFGELGNGTTNLFPNIFGDVTPPTRIASEKSWKAIAAGGIHTLALSVDGTLWAWGGNTSGEVALPTGLFPSTNTPSQVSPAHLWKGIAAGNLHTLAIRDDGSLWAFGYNAGGELGTGSLSSHSEVPVQVGQDLDWASVAAGDWHSVGIRTDGSLWAWGQNANGQLGQGDRLNRTVPVQVAPGTRWKAVSAGSASTLAIRDDGTLWGWGDNTFGQLLQPVSWQPSPIAGDSWGEPAP